MYNDSRRDFLALMGASISSISAYRFGLGAGLTAFSTLSFAEDSESADQLAFMPATRLTQMIRDKQVSSVELTRYFIDRIERYQDLLNAVIVHDFDRALAAAALADRNLMQGSPTGRLHGLPMTIKESYNIAGLPTTYGNPMFKDNIAEEDSVVVKRYKAAGAHFMGKTNVPLNLEDIQTYNDIYGTTNNPWNVERSTGGSSGGSAAALAAGLTGLDSGSDIGGSIRNPAHYCGIYGHKPTWGIVPYQGHSLPGDIAIPDLSVVGPLARSADDLALALDVIAGADELNSPGWKLNLPEPRYNSLRDFRVAIIPTHDISPVDKAITDRITEVAGVLARAGAKVSDTARPDFSLSESYHTYLNLLFPTAGPHIPDAVYEEFKKRPEKFSDKDMSFDAFEARAMVIDHRSWLLNHNARTGLRLQWKRFFEDWDIVLCPIVSTTAIPHDHSAKNDRTITVNGRKTSYLDQLFWAGLATVAYLPSTVFPTGPADDGLPIGLQAISAEFADYTTIEFARLITEEIGGYQPPPGYSAIPLKADV